MSGPSSGFSVFTDLKQRGVEDILIACIDGLKGFPEAIGTIFQKTPIRGGAGITDIHKCNVPESWGQFTPEYAMPLQWD